jgi:hypothetical protein
MTLLQLFYGHYELLFSVLLVKDDEIRFNWDFLNFLNVSEKLEFSQAKRKESLNHRMLMLWMNKGTQMVLNSKGNYQSEASTILAGAR